MSRVEEECPIAVINARLFRVIQILDAVGQRVALYGGTGGRSTFLYDAAGRQTVFRKRFEEKFT